MNSIPAPVHNGLQALLGDTPGTNIPSLRFTPVGGGCINHGGRLTVDGDDYFLKWNNSTDYPGMFEAEARGLALLGTAGAIRIPQVIGAYQEGPYQFILMEFIAGASKAGNYWELLGQRLAALHRKSNPYNGLDHDNYIGSLRQANTPRSSWSEFFIAHRLEAQLKTGVDAGRIGPPVVKRFERLYAHLPDLLVEEPPSLLQGDLWSGNLIVDDTGEPCLVDPAVYYGSREVDLAMTRLFGGFDKRFYEAYEEEFPTTPGLHNRLDIYNLYPLLVHVNLFGQGYLGQVESTLRAYT